MNTQSKFILEFHFAGAKISVMRSSFRLQTFLCRMQGKVKQPGYSSALPVSVAWGRRLKSDLDL